MADSENKEGENRMSFTDYLVDFYMEEIEKYKKNQEKEKQEKEKQKKEAELLSESEVKLVEKKFELLNVGPDDNADGKTDQEPNDKADEKASPSP